MIPLDERSELVGDGVWVTLLCLQLLFTSRPPSDGWVQEWIVS